ncbi:MAG TPA: dodecin family protein [Nitrososphaeraceae archaeon]|nr:dodecin family protein [Nitrososphaeraceae archaeon]
MQLFLMVYKYIDIVGTSPDSIAKAMEDAVDEAAKTVKKIRWAELGRVTLRIENQKIEEYQAEVKIGFEVERGQK